jgi:hypothetical protein
MPEPLTLEQVQARVAEIAILGKRDDEGAHAEEDKLHQDVLRALADREPMAAAALETLKLDHARHCA